MTCYLTDTYSIFVVLIILLVLLWSCSTFFVIFFDNLFYKTLKYNSQDTFDSFCVAVIVLVIFLAITFIIRALFLPDLEKRMLSVDKREEKPTPKGMLDLARRLEVTGGSVTSDPFAVNVRP